MKNIRVWIGPFNNVVLETWDRSYELESVMTPAEAEELAQLLLATAAEARLMLL